MSAVQCVKYTMFVFNFLFFLMGLGIIGIGIYMKVDKQDYEDVSKYDFVTPANIIIAAGVIMLIVAFFGFLGAIKEIPSLLLGFFIMLLLIIILEIAAGAYAYVERDEIEDEITKNFRKKIKEDYYKDPDSGTTKAIDRFQEDFDCCGVNNFTDWAGSYYNTKTGKIPNSCCIDENAKIDGLSCGSTDPKALQLYYKRGCEKEVKDFLKENLLVIGACAIAFAVVQVLGLVFAMYLHCQFRDGKGTLA